MQLLGQFPITRYCLHLSIDSRIKDEIMVSKTVITGGRLAGLACAKRLLDAGYQVEVIEAEPQFWVVLLAGLI